MLNEALLNEDERQLYRERGCPQCDQHKAVELLCERLAASRVRVAGIFDETTLVPIYYSASHVVSEEELAMPRIALNGPPVAESRRWWQFWKTNR